MTILPLRGMKGRMIRLDFSTAAHPAGPRRRPATARFLLQRLWAVLLIGWFGQVPAVPGADASEALVPLVQVLAQADDPQFQLDVLKGMSEGLKGRRNVAMPAGWEAAAAKLSQSSSPAVRELAQSLSLTFGSRVALEALRQILRDPKADSAARRHALETLLSVKDPELPASLMVLLSDAALRSAALRGLAAYDDPGAPAAILEVYPGLNAAEKRDALSTLVSRAGFARELMAAIAAEKLSVKDLSAESVRQLRALKDAGINRQVETLWGVARDSAAQNLREIAKYKKLVQAPRPRADDLSNGRAVYARVCQQCHTLFGTGGSVGPDITGSNRADLDYILHNILDPNAEIPNDYRTSTLETRDDRVLTGIVTRQDQQAVTIVTANETVTVPRNEVESLRLSDFSMMPEGLIQSLSLEEVRDLLAYLRSPAQVPMLALPDNLDLFFNGKDLAGWSGNRDFWRVENGEIVGKSPGLKRNEFLVGPLLLEDFRLVLKVKLVPNRGNSGVQFRSEALPNGSVKGYQADIGAGWWGKLYEEHGRGLLWKESGEAHVKLEDWNTYEIIASGNRIRTALNGNLCVDMDDSPGARRGIIAFQLHSGGPMEVRFKDFQLELNPDLKLVTR